MLWLLLQLERASEWTTARALAQQIDRESRDELPIIPLWQVADHYAWRDRLKGPVKGAVDLYQGRADVGNRPVDRQGLMGETVRELSRAPMFIRFDGPRRLVCIPVVFAVLVIMMPVVERSVLGQDPSGAPAQQAAEAPAKKAPDAPAQQAAECPPRRPRTHRPRKRRSAPAKEASGTPSGDASGTPAKEAAKGTTKAAAAGGANPPAKDSGKEAPKTEAREAIERRPYRISLHLACDPSARIDVAKRAELLQQWQVLVKRFVGPPWAVTIEPDSGPLATVDVSTVAPEVFAGFTTFDKVWVVRVSRPGASGLLDGGTGI